jgi:hypothetical protein
MQGMGCCCGGDATVSGTVSGCLTNPITASRLSGAIVSVVSGATGGPFTTDSSGNYSGTITLTGSGATVVLSVAAASPNDVRFAATSQSFTASVGGSYTVNFSPLPASGYHCLPGTHTCPYPVSDTLHGTDPTFGAFTLIYGTNGLGTGWSVAFNPSYTGVSTCSNQGSIALGHALLVPTSGTPLWRIQWIGVSASNDCPAGSSANAWTGAGQKYPAQANVTIVSCLPLSISVTFGSSFFGVFGSLTHLYPGPTLTITLTE